MRRLVPLLLVASAALALSLPTADAARPKWLKSPQILVPGNPDNQDCRTGVCIHNENTDLIVWKGDIWFVHRTAGSQVLGPNSSLRVYRSTDDGKTFRLQSIIPAPSDRDVRDPHFYFVGKRMFIKAITRLPGFKLRDADAGSISVQTSSADGRTWTPYKPIGPIEWGFWRVVEHDGTYYSAAYQDGDLRVDLYSSRNGTAWKAGPRIYGVSQDTPLETELIPSPSGERMLGLVRMDGTDTELLGFQGRLRTKVCWSKTPFAKWSCPQTLNGVRLDGHVAWWWEGRLFVLARKHLKGEAMKKRTALYELTGNFEGGPLKIREHGELPSAGDTSYAGVAPLGGSRFLITWYSSPPADDPPWVVGFGSRTDIWKATLDLSRLPQPRDSRR